MVNFLQDSDFISKRHGGQHHVVRNVDLETPSWNDILTHLNRNIVSKAKMKILDNLGFVYFDADCMPQVNSLLADIRQTTDKPCSAHCYVSLLEISSTFGRHNDNADVFFWQVQGSTQWRVEQDSQVYEYTLLPNDIIYIPRFVVHEVTPLTPRAGISFGIDY